MNDTFVGFEQGEPYQLLIGYQKGNPVFGPIGFDIMSVPAASNSSLELAIQSVDYILNPNGRTLVLDFSITAIEVIFFVDNVALEFDETAVLEIIPFIPLDIDIRRIEGLFFREHMDIIIQDVDGTGDIN